MSYEAFSPLASKLRPKSLDEIVGQSHLLQAGSILRSLAVPVDESTSTNLSSVILWGPPGVGKTSIALAIAASSDRNIVQLNAVSAGVKDIREAIAAASKELSSYGRGTILFIDEIHRFNRSQQDAVLAEVENGTVLLIAATTENPSISINGPLLSRCNLLELKPLTESELFQVIERAIESPQGLDSAFTIEPDAINAIVKLSSGDARRTLVLLEAITNSARQNGSLMVQEQDVYAITETAALHYDKNSDLHFDVISAFIKSVRGSDVDAALHYLARMLESGEDPRFIARRLMISAAEDVGLADTHALVLATATAQSVALIGMPEARIALSETTIYLALAPKSNSAYLAVNSAIQDVRDGKSGQVPTHLRNTHPSQLKTEKYRYAHDDPQAVVAQQYLPDTLEKVSYYDPKFFGQEDTMGKRWRLLKKIIRGR